MSQSPEQRPVLAIIGRIDRRDSAPPAYRILTPCCFNEQQLSAWVLASVRAHNPDLGFVAHCDECGKWTPTVVPAVTPHA
jgi:hypothetical protein